MEQSAEKFQEDFFEESIETCLENPLGIFPRMSDGISLENNAEIAPKVSPSIPVIPSSFPIEISLVSAEISPRFFKEFIHQKFLL